MPKAFVSIVLGLAGAIQATADMRGANMHKQVWDLSKAPETWEEAKLFAEAMIQKQIAELKLYDPARYTYAWRDRGRVHNLQVFRNGKPEFYISVEDREGFCPLEK